MAAMTPQHVGQVNNLSYSYGSAGILPVTEISAPRQARSRATWARVLDAGVQLLAEGGYEALTIGALCERASATPPSIYARAGNKEGLLLAVYEHAMGQITRTAIHPDDGSWDGLSAPATVTRAVEALCRTWLDNAALLRPIVHRAAHDPEVFRRGSQASREEAHAFRTVLERVGIAPADADACFRVVYATLVQRVMYGEGFESDVALPDDALVQTLVSVATRYVGAAGG
jgi:AcrR family transcriptional regulator